MSGRDNLAFSSLYRGWRGIDRYWFIAIGLDLTFMYTHTCADLALPVTAAAKAVIKTRLITEHYSAKEGNDRCARVIRMA